MYQIDVATAAVSPPASSALGTTGYFTDGDPTSMVPATILPAEFMNALMREMLNLLSAAGITPSKNTFTQVRDSVRVLVEASTGNYSLDTGAANAYVVALNPAPAARSNGMIVRFRVANANTGASTINDGFGAISLLNDVGGALEPGDLQVNAIVSATYDSTATAYLLNSVVQSQVMAPKWVTKTTTYTAVPNDALMCDTTSGPFTVTLPPSPAVNDIVRFGDYADKFATNNLTIARNGKLIRGLAENLICDVNLMGGTFGLQYIDNTEGWRLI